MNSKQLLKIFQQTGALLRGHFELSSGLHSDQYFQCALVLQHPRYTEKIGKALAQAFKRSRVNCVVGLALGGVTLGYEVARSLKARSLFVERRNDQMDLRRGFSVGPGDRILVVEDVITTGGSVLEVLSLLKKTGASVVGLGSIVDRSESKIDFSCPYRSLVKFQAKTFERATCPPCRKSIPLDKPGSRRVLSIKAW